MGKKYCVTRNEDNGTKQNTVYFTNFHPETCEN